MFRKAQRVGYNIAMKCDSNYLNYWNNPKTNFDFPFYNLGILVFAIEYYILGTYLIKNHGFFSAWKRYNFDTLFLSQWKLIVVSIAKFYTLIV